MLEEKKMKVKKGWLAVEVGLEEEDGGFQRFVIPISYLYHPSSRGSWRKLKRYTASTRLGCCAPVFQENGSHHNHHHHHHHLSGALSFHSC
ncbi:hypothetical protein AAG906_024396 [Vitis piasezkii]